MPGVARGTMFVMPYPHSGSRSIILKSDRLGHETRRIEQFPEAVRKAGEVMAGQRGPHAGVDTHEQDANAGTNPVAQRRQLRWYHPRHEDAIIRGCSQRSALAAIVHAQAPGGALFRIEKLDAALDSVVDANAQLEMLGDRFALTEGPVWMPDASGGAPPLQRQRRQRHLQVAAREAALGLSRAQRLHGARHRPRWEHKRWPAECRSC